MQDVKEYLKSYIPALKYVEKCFRELDAAEDVSLRSPKMDGMPRAFAQHGLDEQVARIEGIRKKAEQAREKVLIQLDDIEARIESLERMDQRSILKMRYIYGMKWDEVAQEMNMSERLVYAIHGRALAELRKDWET